MNIEKIDKQLADYITEMTDIGFKNLNPTTIGNIIEYRKLLAMQDQTIMLEQHCKLVELAIRNEIQD